MGGPDRPRGALLPRAPRRAGDREGPGRRGQPDAVPRPARDAEGLGPGLQRHMGSARVWERSAPGSAPAWPGSGPRRRFSSHATSIPRVGQSFRGPRPADSQGGTELAVLPRILPQKLCYVMGINPAETTAELCHLTLITLHNVYYRMPL